MAARPGFRSPTSWGRPRDRVALAVEFERDGSKACRSRRQTPSTDGARRGAPARPALVSGARTGFNVATSTTRPAASWGDVFLHPVKAALHRPASFGGPAPAAGIGGGASPARASRTAAPRSQSPPLARPGPGGMEHPPVVVDDDQARPLCSVGDGGESTRAIMTALSAVFTRHGLPGAVYTDGAHWRSTPHLGECARLYALTQVGQARQAPASNTSSGTPAGPRAQRTRQPHAAGSAGQRAARRGNSDGPGRRSLPRGALPPRLQPDLRPHAHRPAFAFVPVPGSAEPILCHEEARVVARDKP